MGFYLRKSVSVGPLRFNLSKSGIGISAGVKGFRVGAGPRGNYIHFEHPDNLIPFREGTRLMGLCAQTVPDAPTLAC